MFSGGGFSPSSLAMRKWVSPNFSTSPWIGDPSATIPIQVGDNFAPPSAGAAVNGFTPVDFDGINDTLFFDGHFLNTIISSTTYYYAFVVYPRNPIADAGILGNPAIIGDTGINFGLVFSDAGMTAFQYDAGPGWTGVTVACSANNWHFVQVWHDGTNLHCQVDTTVGTPTAIPMTWLDTYITSIEPILGTDGNATWFDGQILAWTSAHHVPTSDQRDGMGVYFQDRYGLSFGLTATKVSPHDVSLTGLWEDSFTTSPWVGIHNTSYQKGFNPATTTINSYVVPDFQSAYYLNTDFTMASYANNNAGSGWVLFKTTSAAAPSGPGLKVGDAGVLVQSSGATTWGITISNIGICHLLYDGAYREIVIYTDTGNWHLAQFKWNGTSMYFRVDKDSWFSYPAGSCDTTPTAGFMNIGVNYAISNFYDGAIAEVGMVDRVMTDLEFEKVLDYVQSKYALNLTVARNPGELVLSGWWRPHFAPTSWIGSPSQGLSNARNIDTLGAYPSAGTALNGYTPFSFDGATTYIQSAATTWADLIEPTLSDTGTISILFYGRNPPAPAGAPYDNPAFVTDTGGSFGIGWTTSGVVGWHYDGTALTYTPITEAASANAWHLVQMRWNATTLEIRVDSGAWQSLAVDSANQPTTGFLKVGANYTSAAFLDASIMEIAFKITMITDDEANFIKSYINTRYGLSL